MKLKTLAGLCILGVASSSVMAAEETNPYIVHRQGIYEIAGGHMEALNSIIMLGHPAKADVNYHATAMLEAFKHHGDAFPKGSEQGKTRADAKIWSDSAGFKEKGDAAGKAIMELIAASEASDEAKIKEKFFAVGKSCKNCHDDYRKKKM